MSDWKGRGRDLAVQNRRDRILAALAARDIPLTTEEVVTALGRGNGIHYGAVYADLRALCGSNTVAGRRLYGDVCADGYPVTWHTWDTAMGGRTVWSLCPAYVEEQTEQLAALEQAFSESAGQE